MERGIDVSRLGGWGELHVLQTVGPTAVTYLIGVEVRISKLASLKPMYQGNLLISQPQITACHLVLHSAPEGKPVRAMLQA